MAEKILLLSQEVDRRPVPAEGQGLVVVGLELPWAMACQHPTFLQAAALLHHQGQAD